MPAALQIDWREIRRACEAGLDMHAAAAQFGVTYDAIRKRGQREHWITCRRLKRIVSQTVPLGQTSAIQAIAADWTARQAAHRETIQAIGNKMLAAVRARMPKVETVSDVAVLDKMMRQNLGLANGEQGVQVNVLFDASGGGGCVCEDE